MSSLCNNELTHLDGKLELCVQSYSFLININFPETQRGKIGKQMDATHGIEAIPSLFPLCFDVERVFLVFSPLRGRGRGGRTSRGGMRGGRGMMQGFGPPGHGRGRPEDGPMNRCGPMRY